MIFRMLYRRKAECVYLCKCRCCTDSKAALYLAVGVKPPIPSHSESRAARKEEQHVKNNMEMFREVTRLI